MSYAVDVAHDVSSVTVNAAGERRRGDGQGERHDGGP